MQFCVNRSFLKWKFFQKRMARVVVDEIARRIVSTDEQALLAVPPNAFGSSLLCEYEAPKRKKCKGVVLVRNRVEVEFEDIKCHAVLRCDHENCEARYWDRDVNAAINMIELLKSEVLGRGRMEPFRRS
ncbi:hypothetical protein PC116_g27636 [Phytophthora cactorum]|uniref:Uncharacterized protein n=1 Tax=Phytophthora cactorum TaxID=29920 RepID=A0A8T1JFK4_9STRA|nr:hypothetical protein PC113_g22619 [Phytophthora cactorum]KAG4223904.1 hypothetical protein PC116_g27636 [Phytophthora cactorum]